MEIFDCGLFGEGVLPTLKHGLKHLMCVPSKEVLSNFLFLVAS